MAALPAAAVDGPAPPPPPEHVAMDIPAAGGTPPVAPEAGATTPPPAHVAVDIPAAGARTVVVVVPEGAAPTTPPPVPHEAGGVSSTRRRPENNHPTRIGPFVRTLVRRLCAVYVLLVAPALVVAALVRGPSPFVQLMVFFAGMFTAAFFIVREAEGKEQQAQAQAQVEVKG